MAYPPYTYEWYRDYDVFSKWIGYVGDDLVLFECDWNNRTIKSYAVQESQVPRAAVVAAQWQRNYAFNLINLAEYPGDGTE